MNVRPLPSGDASGSARRYGVTTSGLTAVLAVSGVLTYGYFVLASHSLSADDYGALVVLWSAVFIVVSVVFRPVELLLSRTIAEREARDESSAAALRIAGTIQLVLGVAFVAVALAFRGPIEDGLLDGRDTLYVFMLGSVLAYGAAFYGRGMLAGQRRFRLFSVLLLLDSLSRLAFAVVVTLGIVDGIDVIALGILVGPIVSLSVIPYALARTAPPEPAPTEGRGAPGPAEFTLSHGAAFAAALFLALLSEQVLLTTGPLFVRDAEGTAAAGVMFNILIVARAPVLLFQAVAATLLPHLSRLRSTGDESHDETFRLSVRLTLAVVAGFAALVVVAVAAVGPQLMEIAFGAASDYDRVGLVWVAGGMGFYLAAATLNQAALARGQARHAGLCWIGAAAAFVFWNLASPLDALRAVEVGFAAAAALLCAGLGVLYLRGPSLAEDELVAGSPQELEATLATADESL